MIVPFVSSWLLLGVASFGWFYRGVRKCDLTVTDVFSYIALKRTRQDEPTLSKRVVWITCAVIIACGPIAGIIQIGDAIRDRA